MNLNIRDEKIKTYKILRKLYFELWNKKTYTEEDRVLISLYSKEMSNIKKVLIKRYNIAIEDILAEM